MRSELMLDSGAFSAWNRGAVINIDDYITFCQHNLENVDYIVNLDVIPGAPFRVPSKKEREESAMAGWKNYKKMLSSGIPKEKLIHVFHQGEDFHWLEKIAKEVPYIGISPANDKTTEQKIAWLNECMQYVTDSDKKATVKFHGFAVTSLEVVFKYPWYSIDSSSWRLIGGGFGKIFTPEMVGPEDKSAYWHNIQTPIGKGVAAYMDKAESGKGFFEHVERKTQSEVSFLNKKYKSSIEQLLNSYHFTLEELEQSIHLRAAWNALYLIEQTAKFSTAKLYLAGNDIKAYRVLRNKMNENDINLNKLNVLTSYAALGKGTRNKDKLNFLEKIHYILSKH